MTRAGADIPPPQLPGAAAAPIGYAPARTARSPSPFDLRPFFTHLISWAFVVSAYLAATVFAIPTLDGIFRDFKLDLPVTTRLLLALGRWPQAMIPLAMLAAVAAGDSVVAGFCHRRSNPRSRRLYRLVVMLLLGGATLFVALAVFVPMVTLIEGLAGK